MSIDPRMWDDERFVALSDLEQNLWTFLLAGPLTVGGVPGLIVGGPASFAEGMRRDAGKVRAALAKLVAVGLVEHDEERRLVRIGNAPKYKPPGNANVVRGWFRRWRLLPESPLKYQHVEALEKVCAKYQDAWADSFGSVDLGKVFRKPFERSSESHGPSLSKETRSSTSAETETSTGTGTGTGTGGAKVQNTAPLPTADVQAVMAPTARGGRKSPSERDRADLIAKHRETAERLWQRQEALRRWSIPGARSLAFTEDACYRVAALLEGGMSEDDVCHVLEVYAAEARANPDQARWFDGVSNLRKENAARALGRTVASVARGRSPPTPFARQGLTATEIMQAAERMREAEEAKRSGSE